MIEYLYNVIRVTQGSTETVAAVLQDDTGATIREQCHLTIYDGAEKVITIYGSIVKSVWNFTIPAEVSAKLIPGHRYTYCICDSTDKALCFKQPIYFV